KELLEITVDEEGVFSTWSEDVFSESLTEILEMQKAIKRKEQKD
ncbi:MAG: DUF3696 domain-containing protein, partial [Microcystis sp. M074S1]|nr:DUF3696 domain-containing protein [Microcystis sp. M074S1]